MPADEAVITRGSAVHRSQSAASRRTTELFEMDRVGRHTRALTARALLALRDVDRRTVYGPAAAAGRAPLVAFNVDGMSPFAVAEALDRRGVEARAGCHCATLARHALKLDPPASCRLSFSLYNTVADVDRAVRAVTAVLGGRLT